MWLNMYLLPFKIIAKPHSQYCLCMVVAGLAAILRPSSHAKHVRSEPAVAQPTPPGRAASSFKATCGRRLRRELVESHFANISPLAAA